MTSSLLPHRGSLASRLDELLDDQLLKDFWDSMSANTRKSYRADLVDFGGWCHSTRRRWDTPDTISAYLRNLEGVGAAYATIERRKTAIAKLVQAEALLNAADVDLDPTKHPKVTVTLQAIRNRVGTDQDRAIPLTADRLIQVLLAIDDTTLAGRRDIALLLIGWYGAFRRSELAGMRRHHLQIDDHGVGIALPRSKGAQDHTVYVPILRQPTSRWDPIAALEYWTTTLDTQTTPGAADGIWLHITKGDTFGRTRRPISGDAINNIVIRRVKAAGLWPTDDEGSVGNDEQDEDDPRPTYSAHSLRAGFITEAKNRGIDEADIMKHSRHKSLATMRLYDRTSGWWNRNATAQLTL